MHFQQVHLYKGQGVDALRGCCESAINALQPLAKRRENLQWSPCTFCPVPSALITSEVCRNWCFLQSDMNSGLKIKGLSRASSGGGLCWFTLVDSVEEDL